MRVPSGSRSRARPRPDSTFCAPALRLRRRARLHLGARATSPRSPLSLHPLARASQIPRGDSRRSSLGALGRKYLAAGVAPLAHDSRGTWARVPAGATAARTSSRGPAPARRRRRSRAGARRAAGRGWPPPAPSTRFMRPPACEASLGLRGLCGNDERLARAEGPCGRSRNSRWMQSDSCLEVYPAIGRKGCSHHLCEIPRVSQENWLTNGVTLRHLSAMGISIATQELQMVTRASCNQAVDGSGRESPRYRKLFSAAATTSTHVGMDHGAQGIEQRVPVEQPSDLVFFEPRPDFV